MIITIAEVIEQCALACESMSCPTSGEMMSEAQWITSSGAAAIRALALIALAVLIWCGQGGRL